VRLRRDQEIALDGGREDGFASGRGKASADLGAGADAQGLPRGGDVSFDEALDIEGPARGPDVSPHDAGHVDLLREREDVSGDGARDFDQARGHDEVPVHRPFDAHDLPGYDDVVVDRLTRRKEVGISFELDDGASALPERPRTP
jgi:hypothetical protein